MPEGIERPPLSVRRWIWFAFLTLLLLGPFFARAYVTTSTGQCALEAWAGFGCPGCGFSRSMASLSEARIGDAFRLHFFAPLVYLLILGLWAYYLVAVFRNREPFRIRPRHTARVWLGLLVGLLAYWGVRLAADAVP